ncbi:MAG: nucleoside-triphosphatase [Armatimonadota bacterium]
MLLVAITGSVGSEKSKTLAQFADRATGLGYSVDGFVSVACDRPVSDKGALSYTLYWVKTGEETLFASRHQSGGYEIEAATIQKLSDWSQQLTSHDVIVLDEFGKWEAEGNGLIDIWPNVQLSKPRMVVVTLREGVQSEVEFHLGKKFDLVMSVGPGCDKKLISTLIELREWEHIGVYGAGSGAIEWSVGSWLHATKFPFTGTVMGALQAAVLALVSERMSRKSLTVWVSLISAGIKAMSSAGARITPTIAITVQGFLFTIGAMIFRWSRLGIAVGAFLVGVWAALQGFFIQVLLLGKSLEKAWDASIHYLAKETGIAAPSFWLMAIVLALVNGAISMGVTLAVTGKRNNHRAKIEQMMFAANSPERSKNSSIFGDVVRPIFWFPLAIVAIILLVGREQPLHIVWMALRAVAIILAVNGLARLVKAERINDWLARKGHWGPAIALRSAARKTNSPRE